MTHKKMIEDFFINDWFPNADKIADNSYFLSYCADDIEFNIDGEHYVGHQGFVEWMKGPRSTLKPDIKHIVETIDVIQLGNDKMFDVQMVVSVDATTLTNEPVSFRANDSWKISVTERNEIVIRGRVAKTIT
jgi:hypothetical protein